MGVDRVFFVCLFVFIVVHYYYAFIGFEFFLANASLHVTIKSLCLGPL